MPAWREWLLGNRGRTNRKTALILASDVWERAGKRAPATLPIIAEIEASAVEVYAAHGLKLCLLHELHELLLQNHNNSI